MNRKQEDHTNWPVWYIVVIVFLVIQILLYIYLTDHFH